MNVSRNARIPVPDSNGKTALRNFDDAEDVIS